MRNTRAFQIIRDQEHQSTHDILIIKSRLSIRLHEGAHEQTNQLGNKLFWPPAQTGGNFGQLRLQRE